METIEMSMFFLWGFGCCCALVPFTIWFFIFRDAQIKTNFWLVIEVLNGEQWKEVINISDDYIVSNLQYQYNEEKVITLINHHDYRARIESI